MNMYEVEAKLVVDKETELESKKELDLFLQESFYLIEQEVIKGTGVMLVRGDFKNRNFKKVPQGYEGVVRAEVEGENEQDVRTNFTKFIQGGLDNAQQGLGVLALTEYVKVTKI